MVEVQKLAGNSDGGLVKVEQASGDAGFVYAGKHGQQQSPQRTMPGKTT